MELVVVPLEMRPTGRECHRAAGAMGIGEPCVGAIAVALQQSREAGEVVRGAFAAAAVLEPVRHHWWAGAAEGSVIARVRPDTQSLPCRCRARGVGSVVSSGEMRSPLRMWCKIRSASGSRVSGGLAPWL